MMDRDGNTYAIEQQLEARVAELEAALQSILEIPNSEAAQGIMKVFARAALKETS
jgi:hypothetical protein